MDFDTDSTDRVYRRRLTVQSESIPLRDALQDVLALPPISEELQSSVLQFCGNADSAKNLLVNYCHARQNIVKVFRNRHPGCLIDNDKLSAVRVGTLTNALSSKWIIFCAWLNDSDPAKFSIYQAAKLIFCYLDLLLQKNRISDKTLGLVFDLRGFTSDHVQMVTRFAASQIIKLCKNSFPVKCGPILILNSEEGLSQLTGFLAPFDFHIIDNVEDLAGFLPGEFLPCDLGGVDTNPTTQELDETFMHLLWCYGSRLTFEEHGWEQNYIDRVTFEKLPEKTKKEGKQGKKKRKGKKKK